MNSASGSHIDLATAGASSVSVAPRRANPVGPARALPSRRLALLLCLLSLASAWLLPPYQLAAADEPSAAPEDSHFPVQAYRIEAISALPTNVLERITARHSGTNVDLKEIIEAASEVQTAYNASNANPVSVALRQEDIKDGVVTMFVFQGGTDPQILVSGVRRHSIAELAAIARAAAATNNPATNIEFKTTVRAYAIEGNTLLTVSNLTAIFGKYTGTNIGSTEILKAAGELQTEYITHGYPSVSVRIPKEQPTFATNRIFLIRVFEGKLWGIQIEGNRFFSSNNIMRELPSLHTNTIIIGPVVQAELNRANANQDRQIYSEIAAGPVENTSLLLLHVQDKLPLHGKAEFNDQSSPGTPEFRINTSAVYNNLWQHEHSLGVQYSFSPQQFKDGSQWADYDKPLVVNYSGFYRLPLGNPEPIENRLAAQPGTFGYDEATRKFNPPPPTGQAELNVYASRSVIDTGLDTLDSSVIYNVPGVRQVFRQDVQQDFTINNDLGARVSDSLPYLGKLHSSVSSGLDFKTYEEDSFKTNLFKFTEITVNADGTVNPPIISTVASPVPATRHPLEYLPLAVRYDGSLQDSNGITAFGLGITANLWYSGSRSNLHGTVGSTKASGNYVLLSPSFNRDFTYLKKWTLSLHAEGQWSSEPLLSTEQFGAGGVANVRGYREGEVFGDNGWRINLEQKTPPHVVGVAWGNVRMTIRGSIFMDYAQTFLIDPQGRSPHTDLWGTGFGGVASLGSYWEARLLASWPLLGTTTTEAYQPRFNFSLTSQF
jgi:hemolysin activation/secretion protein